MRREDVKLFTDVIVGCPENPSVLDTAAASPVHEAHLSLGNQSPGNSRDHDILLNVYENTTLAKSIATWWPRRAICLRHFSSTGQKASNMRRLTRWSKSSRVP